jgi:hypothetical protein
MSGTYSNPSVRSGVRIVLGLRENWQQFSLLVLINAFVGMVGLQSTVVPMIGAQEFKIASTTTVLFFIVSFGVIKALANLVLRTFCRRLWPQNHARSRRAHRPSGPIHDCLGTELELDHRGECAARHVVKDGFARAGKPADQTFEIGRTLAGRSHSSTGLNQKTSETR